jgi:hypothetical protein
VPNAAVPSEIEDVTTAWLSEALGVQISDISLDACGVTDYTFDEAWRHYRFAVAYLMILPVITLLSWETLPERSRTLCITLVERAVATIDDIGALEVFE